MNSSINLVSNKSVEVEKELRRLRQFKIITLVVLITVSLVSILIFILNFTLPIASVKNDQQLTMANLTAMNKKLVTYALTKDRIGNISKIILQRGNFVPKINKILGKVPAELSIRSLEIQKDTLKISVSGNSLTPINKFIDDIVLLGKDQKVIKNIIIQGLSLDTASGNYILSIQTGLP